MAADAGAGIEVQQQVAALQDQLSQACQARDSALRQNEQLSGQFREAQARIVEMASTPPPPAAPAAQQPTDMVDHEALGVDTLNLPEKAVKACAKHDIQTIGQLREFFPKFAEPKMKVNQKDRLVVAEALMGRISFSPSVPAPTAAPSANAASDVPAGHTDRPWKARLKVARFKENKGKDLIAALSISAAKVRELAPTFPAEGEREFWAKAIPAVVSVEGEDREKAITLLAAFIGEKVVQEITSSQVAAMLYALGFDPKQSRQVDPSLEAAGLVHLVESVPATVAP
jgi:hypothetical protein